MVQSLLPRVTAADNEGLSRTTQYLEQHYVDHLSGLPLLTSRVVERKPAPVCRRQAQEQILEHPNGCHKGLDAMAGRKRVTLGPWEKQKHH